MSDKQEKSSETVAEVETVVWTRPSGNKITLKATKEMEAYATKQGWEREGGKARK